MTDLYLKGDVRIRPSIHHDIERMKDSIRESDRLEIAASHNQTPYEALSYGLRYSAFCATMLYKNEPVAMFGVVPDDSNKKAGVAWLLATNDVYRVRWTFLKLSRRYIKLMQNRYPLLYNFVDDRNIVTMRWLGWLGANIGDAKSYGANNKLFRYFSFEKEKVTA